MAGHDPYGSPWVVNKGQLGAWVENVVQVYKRMDDIERNDLLDKLLGVSSAIQERHLRGALKCLENPVDFISFLPLELSQLILNYLDIESILNCIKVCRHWNNFISNLDSVWLVNCKRRCVRVDEFLDRRRRSSTEPMAAADVNPNCTETAKSFCLRICRMLRDIKSGDAFCLDELRFSNDNVKALHLWKNTLFIANNEIISIYNLKTLGFPPRSIKVNAGMTSVRGDDKLVVASNVRGTLNSWNRLDSYKKLEFGAHSTPVMSFDYNHELDVLVSGSSDRTVKLFSLRCAIHQRTLREHDNWVVKVLLGQTEKHNLLFTMTQTTISVWKCLRSSRNVCDDFSCDTQIPIQDEIPIFTPGLHFDGQHVFYVQPQVDMPRKAELCQFDLQTGRLARTYPFNMNVKILLWVGRKHACFLKPRADKTTFGVVLDLETMECVASWCLPATSNPITPDNPQISFGENVWLRDGIDGFNNVGAIMAIGCGFKNNEPNAYLLRWRGEGETDNQMDSLLD